MQKLRIVPASVALLVTIAISILVASGAQAYSLMPAPWPKSNTVYKLLDSLRSRPDWEQRAIESADAWSPYFVFLRNDGADILNQVGAGTPLDTLNLAETWTIEDQLGIYRTRFGIIVNVYRYDDDWYAGIGTPPQDKYDLKSVLRHEFGHAAGLGHALTGPTSQLMRPTLGLGHTYDPVGDDERNGLRYLYEAGYNLTHPDNSDYSDAVRWVGP